VALSSLLADTLYHYRVLSRDAAGNLAMSPDATFRTAATSGATLTLWAATATPAEASTGDRQAVELGVKFWSDVSGQVLGVRFYKGPSNAGVHVASLWSATGVRVATATFSGETETGWQEVRFASPVTIAANTTYVVSYHADAGGYARTFSYFATSFTSGVLHAPDSASSNGNGVYAYGPSAFPTSTYGYSNYWVDVVFQPQ